MRSAFKMRLRIRANVVEKLVQKEVPRWELPGQKRTGRKVARSWGRPEVGRDRPPSDASVSLAALARRSVSARSGLGAVAKNHAICNSNKKY